MGQGLPLFDAQFVLDDDATSALGAAYEKATCQLRGDGYTDLHRDIIAERIIETARRGERDPDRLCAAALASLRFRD
jgi:hypothetical protein